MKTLEGPLTAHRQIRGQKPLLRLTHSLAANLTSSLAPPEGCKRHDLRSAPSRPQNLAGAVVEAEAEAVAVVGLLLRVLQRDRLSRLRITATTAFKGPRRLPLQRKPQWLLLPQHPLWRLSSPAATRRWHTERRR